MPDFPRLLALLCTFVFSFTVLQVNRIFPLYFTTRPQLGIKTVEIVVNAFNTALPLVEPSTRPAPSPRAWNEDTVILAADQAPFCTVPYLHQSDETIIKYCIKRTSVQCAKIQGDLTFVNNGRLHFDGNALRTHYPDYWKNIRCAYRYFDGSLGKDRLTVTNFSSWSDLHVGQPVNLTDDFVEVQCTKNFKLEYLYKNIYARFSPRRHKIYEAQSEAKLSLHIIVLDSTSLTMFRRFMPKTRAFMERKMQSVFFRGHLKTGDNSMPNLIAMLAGKRIHNQSDIFLSDFAEEFIPGGRVKMDNEHQPWLWKIFNDNGCATLFNDDVVSWGRGIFHYPFKVVTGFNKKPTDHYLRPFWVHLRKWMINNSTKYCYGNRPIHQIQIDLIENYIRSYAQMCQFSFSFITELPHDFPYDLGRMDADFTDFLGRMHDEGRWNNSVVLIVGDHGHRMTPARKIYVGKIEERLPLLSFSFPAWFREKYPRLMATMRVNADRMTSHFDTHRTLVELATNTFATERDDKSSGMRGRSLFRPIPLNRTCTDASVPEQHCVCLQAPFNKSITPSQRLVDTAANMLITRLNDYVTKRLPSACRRFQLGSVLDSAEVRVNELVYHGCRNYYEDCYQPIGTWKSDLVQYRLRLQLVPSNWTLESVVQYNDERRLLRSVNPLVIGDKSGSDLGCPAVDDTACYCGDE